MGKRRGLGGWVDGRRYTQGCRWAAVPTGSSAAAKQPCRYRQCTKLPAASAPNRPASCHLPCLPRLTCLPPPRLPCPQLLGYIKKDKQGDALIEKLCQRFAASEDPAQWHSIAFCLTQVLLLSAAADRCCCCCCCWR